MIPFKLFLDMVPSSFSYITRVVRGCFRGGFVYVSLGFKAKDNLHDGCFFFIYINEAKKLLSWLELVGAASVCSFGSHIV